MNSQRFRHVAGTASSSTCTCTKFSTCTKFNSKCKHFFNWSKGVVEERTGLGEQNRDILGLGIPLIEIPVRPGRDMALLVEVAAMVRALKLMGHDSAEEFNQKLIQHMESSES